MERQDGNLNLHFIQLENTLYLFIRYKAFLWKVSKLPLITLQKSSNFLSGRLLLLKAHRLLHWFSHFTWSGLRCVWDVLAYIGPQLGQHNYGIKIMRKLQYNYSINVMPKLLASFVLFFLQIHKKSVHVKITVSIHNNCHEILQCYAILHLLKQSDKSYWSN